LNQSFTKDGLKPYGNIQESKLFFVSLSYSFSKKSTHKNRNKKRRPDFVVFTEKD